MFNFLRRITRVIKITLLDVWTSISSHFSHFYVLIFLDPFRFHEMNSFPYTPSTVVVLPSYPSGSMRKEVLNCCYVSGWRKHFLSLSSTPRILWDFGTKERPLPSLVLHVSYKTENFPYEFSIQNGLCSWLFLSLYHCGPSPGHCSFH